MIAKWVPFPGFEDRYEISNQGEVRSKHRDIRDKFGKLIRTVPPFLEKIHTDSETDRDYVIIYDTKYHKRYIDEALEEVSFDG